MAASDTDTARVAVKTYVPAYQRDEWDEHADELDMNRSEFVRSMVQAGRRGFDPGGSTTQTAPDEATESGDHSTDTVADSPDDRSGETAGESTSFDELVLELLEGECLSWAQLVEELTEDVEQRLDDSIQRLQAANQVQHSGRQGGYVRVE